MLEMTVKDPQRVINALKSNIAGINRAVKQYMIQAAEDWRAYIEKTYLNGRPGLKVDTGILHRSYSVQYYGEGLNSGVKIGFSNRAWYAKVHEHYDFGGDIYPKNAEYLTFKIGKRWFRKEHVYIPQRLFIRRDWARFGYRKLMVTIQGRLNAYLKLNPA
jgi:hypothetical protein